MQKRKELLQSFVAQYLKGDIEQLKDFELGKLRYDKVFGCPGRKFDSDDTELMRAIYFLVFGDAWGIDYDVLDKQIVRGDTINTYSTLFSRPWDKPDRFVEKWSPDEAFLEKRKAFHLKCYTVGNMTILPNIPLEDWTINCHRGCHDEWHDYEDRFLAAQRLVLLNDPQCDPDLKELVDLNSEYFKPFFGDDGWRKFIDSNMLEYYVDENYVPVIASKGYVYWRGGYTNRERFYAECHRYMNFTTELINDRADRIIAKLKALL